MSMYFAHSGGENSQCQRYEDHINNVVLGAIERARNADKYNSKDRGKLPLFVKTGALYHDLGKLDERNQEAIVQGKRGKLPINHVDAGCALLLKRDRQFSTMSIYGHHRGLPDCSDEDLKADKAFRDLEISSLTDLLLPEYLKTHRSIMGVEDDDLIEEYEGDPAVFQRMMLSCIADSDHSDTALHYGKNVYQNRTPLLNAEARLSKLDEYIKTLGDDSERNTLRREMYISARNCENTQGFCACDSPVGSGKTTAVMAHLLQQAVKRGARRIFVILPYTSIITQAVEVYRRILTLPNEKPEEVIAEVHSRAEYEHENVRYLSALWQAPIVVTTAVAFFETLAANKPSALRKLHELPGSVVFLDEAHASLPVKLLPVAWRWMKILADEWKVYWLFASGSLVEFWRIPEIVGIRNERVPRLVEKDLTQRLMTYEKNRIHFHYLDRPVSRKQILEMVLQSSGPRIVIVNTIRTAAVLADDLFKEKGREAVEHLSTALTPADRAKTIERIRQRLKNPADSDWTLIATSCVEAGVDFSFRTGFREIASLASLLQAAGRVNRHGECQKANMWSFSLRDDTSLATNPSLIDSADILRRYFQKGMEITPELCTDAIKREIRSADEGRKGFEEFLDMEDAGQFKTVAGKFKVIDSDSILAIVDDGTASKILSGEANWLMVQTHSVAIPRYCMANWLLKEIMPEVYKWTLPYTTFLGYMEGVLNHESNQ